MFTCKHSVCYPTAFCRGQTKVLHAKKSSDPKQSSLDKSMCMDPVHAIRFTAHKLWIALGLLQSKYPKQCFACFFMFFEYYCWWKKSCTSWYGQYSIIYRVSYIPGGAGFQPSTVWPTTCLFHSYVHAWRWMHHQMTSSKLFGYFVNGLTLCLTAAKKKQARVLCGLRGKAWTSQLSIRPEQRENS